MKYFFSILIVALSLVHANAQVETHATDSISKRIDNVVDPKLGVVDSMTNKFDKVSNKTQSRVEAVQQRVDSLTHKPDSIIRSKIAMLDSVKIKLTGATGKVEGFGQNATDSINMLLNKYQQKVISNKLTNKADSLKSLNLPHEKYLGKLDSLQSINPLEKAQGKVTSAQSKVNGVSENVTGGISEKMNLLSKEAGGKGNLPANLDLPSSDLNLSESMKLPSAKMPSVDLPAAPSVNTEVPNVNQPNVSMPDDVTKLSSNLELPKIDQPKMLSKVDDLSSVTDQVSEVTDKVSGYAEDVKNIKEGKAEKLATLESDVISKLPVNDELELLQKNDQLIKAKEAEIKSYRNPEEYKRQTLARAKKMVAQQLVTYEKELQATTAKVSKYHSTAGNLLSKKNDLPKKRDSLRKLKTIERMSPGITFQVQKPSAWLIDINPTLRYRLTLYWSIGAGWNERIVLGDYPTSYNQTRIYGGRLFTDVLLFKGLSGRLEVEDINMFVPPQQAVTQDVGLRKWIWCYNVGLKKEFSFVPKVIGNVQFMYNLYRSSDMNPYASRFNVRFGFEPVLKSSVKKNKKS